MDYWQKQTADTPLFSDMLWSRPENRLHAGKLLIIGGNLHGFAAPASAYQSAQQAGVGTTKVLLPNALQKTVRSIVDNAEFAPSTPSGSFSKQALAEWLDWTRWADGILLAGDLGRNSETAIACESYVSKVTQPLVITKDAVDYFYTAPHKVLTHPHVTLVISLAQLQKLCNQSNWPEPVTFGMDMLQLVRFLHALTVTHPCAIITYHHDTFFVAYQGKVSTTKVATQETWRVRIAAHAAVWQLQNSDNLFAALSTAVLER